MTERAVHGVEMAGNVDAYSSHDALKYVLNTELLAARIQFVARHLT